MTLSFDHASRQWQIAGEPIQLDYLTSLADGQAINTLVAGLF